MNIEPVKFCGWSTGKIKEINKENMLIVLVDGRSENEAITLPLSSYNIAPYGVHTDGYEWRKELKEGSKIDCIDTVGNWYRSTVISTKEREIEEQKIFMVKVGFRDYEDSEINESDKEKAYNGWSKKYDEWLNPYSIRIQKPMTLTKVGKIACKKIYDEEDNEIIDDSSDILINSAKGINTYAVLRSEKVKSMPIVDMINAFGNKGGFDNILKRVSDRNKFVPYGNICFHFRCCFLLD